MACKTNVTHFLEGGTFLLAPRVLPTGQEADLFPSHLAGTCQGFPNGTLVAFDPGKQLAIIF